MTASTSSPFEMTDHAFHDFGTNSIRKLNRIGENLAFLDCFLADHLTVKSNNRYLVGLPRRLQCAVRPQCRWVV